ncbi:MAG TPA: hypothetical protein VFG81_14425 [Anaerolineales bacterium]|jgi:hypothetical protein|nr:hypothetical protein [Anaerolineales bacterium]
MNLGAIVEVAIGIIFVWIVLSLTTIQIQEWISTWLDKRAHDMEDAIHEMLANPNLKAQFYDHPVIRGLTAKKRREPSVTDPWYYRYPLIRGFTKERRRLPSYIPSQQFALTLFDIAMTAGTESSLLQQGILKLRDDLERDRGLSPNNALIVELNLLAELARSAAATEAGTALTQKTLAMLKTEAHQFVDKIKVKYPKLKLEGEMELILRQEIDKAIKEAERLKQDMDQVVKNQPKKDLRTSLGQLRRGVAALGVISPEVNQALNALLLNVEEYVTEGETNLAKARKNVEVWFNDSMDRVSGAYKRYAQTLALIIGFLTALFLNIDSIGLTFYLWREPSVRAVLAERAQDFNLDFTSQGTNAQSDPLQTFREQFTGLKLPVGWSLKDKGDTLFAAPATDTPAPRCEIFPTANDYFGVSFSSNSPGFLKNKCLMPSQPDRSTNLFIKLLGIVITAVAARQGAPFWFDILKRAVNLRGTGTNPAEK